MPVRVQDVGHVVLGPDLRRGVADWNGQGDVVAGIVVMRQGENALAVIDRVKAKLKELEPGLPAGVKIVTAYDRSDLILRSIDNLKHTLTEEMAIVSLIILVFLWHIPSAIIPVFTIPIAIIICFIPMKAMGLSSNIMSLGGIAIAIGAMVDAAIVVVEQTHKKLEEWERNGSQGRLPSRGDRRGEGSGRAKLLRAAGDCGVVPAGADSGSARRPAVQAAGVYQESFDDRGGGAGHYAGSGDAAVVHAHEQLSSFGRVWLCRATNAVLVGKIHSEENHPISKILIRVYEPICAWALRWKWLVLAGATVMVAVTVPVFFKLGSEFMPPLDEGTLLYMPSTLPGISVAQAQQLMQVQDRIIRQFPEVDTVLGKAGRAETSTDPAPLSMVETVITLKPRSEWRKVDTLVLAGGPEWMQQIFRPFHAGSNFYRPIDRRDERCAEAAGHVERLDHADQGAHRHAEHGYSDAGGREDLWRRHRM